MPNSPDTLCVQLDGVEGILDFRPTLRCLIVERLAIRMKFLQQSVF